MSPLHSFHVFINERLISVAAEIFGAFEKIVAEYQEENNHLRRLLRITPEVQLCQIDSLQFSLSLSEAEVPTEQQHFEQEWSPSLGQEDPEPTQIKEEQEELRISQEEEQLQGPIDTEDSILTPPSVKSECDLEDRLWSWTLPQTQTEENRESQSKQADLKLSETVTHLKDLDLPCDPQDIQNNQREEVRRDPGRFDRSPPLDPSSLLNKISQKCNSCNKILSTCNAKFDFRHSQLEKVCHICSKTSKGNSAKHSKTHTGEKSYTCGLCGKMFSQRGLMRRHILTHTGEKPFSCGVCKKSFSQKAHLKRHIMTHTGEKPFNCGDCGKSFTRKEDLTRHILTHTGEKPFSWGDCRKSFNQKADLKRYIRTHTGEKQKTI